MINIEEAIKACLDFFSTIGFTLDKKEVIEYFRANEPIYHDNYSLGHAKYTAIDFFNDNFRELTSDEEDLIHDYYSQLI